MVERLWKWFSKKETLEAGTNHPQFNEREIWLAHLGKNIGSEQDGKGEEFLRPVIVLRKFNTDIFWAIPLTRTIKKSPFYFVFSFGKNESSAILSQIRLIDVKRLVNLVGYIDKKDFHSLKQKFKALLP